MLGLHRDCHPIQAQTVLNLEGSTRLCHDEGGKGLGARGQGLKEPRGQRLEGLGQQATDYNVYVCIHIYTYILLIILIIISIITIINIIIII